MPFEINSVAFLTEEDNIRNTYHETHHLERRICRLSTYAHSQLEMAYHQLSQQWHGRTKPRDTIMKCFMDLLQWAIVESQTSYFGDIIRSDEFLDYLRRSDNILDCNIELEDIDDVVHELEDTTAEYVNEILFIDPYMEVYNARFEYFKQNPDEFDYESEDDFEFHESEEITLAIADMVSELQPVGVEIVEDAADDTQTELFHSTTKHGRRIPEYTVINSIDVEHIDFNAGLIRYSIGRGRVCSDQFTF